MSLREQLGPIQLQFPWETRVVLNIYFYFFRGCYNKSERFSLNNSPVSSYEPILNSKQGRQGDGEPEVEICGCFLLIPLGKTRWNLGRFQIGPLFEMID